MPKRSAIVRFYRLARFDQADWANDPIPALMASAPAEGAIGTAIEMGSRSYLVERGAVGCNALMISNLRDEALFAVAQGGVTHPIDLEEDEQIAMQTHVAFLPGVDIQTRIVGMIRSNVTPGYQQVGNVLSRILADDVVLYPLMRDDPAAMVRISETAKQLTIRFAQDQANVLAAASTVLEDNSKRIAEMTGIRDVELTLRFTEDGGTNWRGRIVDLAEAIAGIGVNKPSAKASIVDEDGLTQIVDLIADDLTRRVERPIEDGEPRTLSADTAADMIYDAYNVMLPAISNSLQGGD